MSIYFWILLICFIIYVGNDLVARYFVRKLIAAKNDHINALEHHREFVNKLVNIQETRIQELEFTIKDSEEFIEDLCIRLPVSNLESQ